MQCVKDVQYIYYVKKDLFECFKSKEYAKRQCNRFKGGRGNRDLNSSAPFTMLAPSLLYLLTIFFLLRHVQIIDEKETMLLFQRHRSSTTTTWTIDPFSDCVHLRIENVSLRIRTCLSTKIRSKRIVHITNFFFFR